MNGHDATLLKMLSEAVQHQSAIDSAMAEFESRARELGEGDWTIMQKQLVDEYIRELAADQDDEEGELKITEQHVVELFARLWPPL